MDGAKGVAHVDVCKLGKASREGSNLFVSAALAFFFGMEPQVLEEDDGARGRVGARSFDLRRRRRRGGGVREGYERRWGWGMGKREREGGEG